MSEPDNDVTMSEDGVTMPDCAAMMRILGEVSDVPLDRERLHLRICYHLADQEVSGAGVVNALLLSIHEYTQGAPLMIAITTGLRMEGYIEALAPEEIRQEALDYWVRVQEVVRG